MDVHELYQTCSKCKIDKLVAEFDKATANKDGLKGFCKECRLKADREYRKRKSLTVIIPDLKTCPSCNLTKNSSSFSKNQSTGDGLYPYCKECDAKIKKERRKKNQARETIVIPEFKTCPKCKTEKRGAGFYRANGNDSGLTSLCKECLGVYQRWTMYGVTEEWYNAELEANGFACPICTAKFTEDNPPCVDHDHLTDEPRGLLCGLCNRGIGNLRDSTRNLQNAIVYLDKGKKSVTLSGLKPTTIFVSKGI